MDGRFGTEPRGRALLGAARTARVVQFDTGVQPTNPRVDPFPSTDVKSAAGSLFQLPDGSSSGTAGRGCTSSSGPRAGPLSVVRVPVASRGA